LNFLLGFSSLRRRDITLNNSFKPVQYVLLKDLESQNPELYQRHNNTTASKAWINPAADGIPETKQDDLLYYAENLCIAAS
jgi:hypothetical protein